jgi:hypothetical protein
MRSLRVGDERVVEGMEENARYDSDGVVSGGAGGGGELERREGGATNGGEEYREEWDVEALAAGGGRERCCCWSSSGSYCGLYAVVNVYGSLRLRGVLVLKEKRLCE